MYFRSTNDIKELKARFRELAKKLHPDKPTGSHAEYIRMKQEYEDRLKTAGFKPNEAAAEASIYDKLMEVFNGFADCEAITIELTGSWIWVSGDTYPIKDRLKENGFRFSRTKKRWYYAANLRSKKRHKAWDWNRIKNTYGYDRKDVNNNKEEEEAKKVK